MDRGEQRNKKKFRMIEKKKHPYKKGGKMRTFMPSATTESK